MRTGYAYGAYGERTSATSADGTAYYVYDGRGSVSELLEGTDAASYRYDPFGAMTQGEPTYDRLFGFNGEEYTPQTGLQYLRARHYAPEDGRFITQDSYLGTLTNTASQNRYTYCENDPVNYIDPSGYAKSSGSGSSGSGTDAFGRDNRTGLLSYEDAQAFRDYANGAGRNNGGAIILMEVKDGVAAISVLVPVPDRYDFNKNPKAATLVYTYQDKGYFKFDVSSNAVPSGTPNSTTYIPTTINVPSNVVEKLVEAALPQEGYANSSGIEKMRGALRDGLGSGGTAFNKFLDILEEAITATNESKTSAQIGFVYGIIVDYGLADAAAELLNAFDFFRDGTWDHLSSDIAIKLYRAVTNEFAFHIGRAVADMVMILVGIAEGLGGLIVGAAGVSLGTGGTVVSITGIGTIIGVPAAALGAVVTAAGGLMVAQGVQVVLFAADNFGNNVNKAIDSLSQGIQSPKPYDGMKVTEKQALDMADEFLGKGYREVSPGVFRSQDGLRQVRMTDSDLNPSPKHAGGIAHLNFETGTSIIMPNGRVSFRVTENIHVFIE